MKKNTTPINNPKGNMGHTSWNPIYDLFRHFRLDFDSKGIFPWQISQSISRSFPWTIRDRWLCSIQVMKHDLWTNPMSPKHRQGSFTRGLLYYKQILHLLWFSWLGVGVGGFRFLSVFILMDLIINWPGNEFDKFGQLPNTIKFQEYSDILKLIADKFDDLLGWQ